MAASVTLRPISLVVAVCSSTAEAIVDWVSLIWAMIAEMSVIGEDAVVGEGQLRVKLEVIAPGERARDGEPCGRRTA